MTINRNSKLRTGKVSQQSTIFTQFHNYSKRPSSIESPRYMAFVDYEKASDSSKHKAILNALEQHSIPGKLINTLTEAYQNGTVQAKAEKLSRKINIMEGVRQGGTLSPIMFIAAVEEIFKRIEWDSGKNIKGVRLNNLRLLMISFYL